MLVRMRKAIVAGLGAGVAAYVAGATDGVVSQADWITVVSSAIVVGVSTYFVRNRDDRKSTTGSTAPVRRNF